MLWLCLKKCLKISVQGLKSIAFLMFIGLCFSSAQAQESFTNNKNGDLSASVLAFENVRKAYETRLAGSVQQMLEKVVGVGNVTVSVQADIDFNQNIINREVLDSDMPIVQTSKTNNTAEEITYIFSKKNIQQIQNGGVIKKLSVAVLIDSSGAVIDKENLYSLIKTAIGFDVKRGDKIEFLTTPFKNVSGPKTLLSPTWVRFAEFALLIFAVVIVFIWIIWERFSSKTSLESQSSLPAFANAEVVSDLLKESPARVELKTPLMKKVHQRVENDMSETVNVLCSWFYQDPKEGF